MDDLSLLLSRRPEAVMEAREWVREAMERATPAAPDAEADVLVMVSELVSNVLRHTSSQPWLSFTSNGGAIRVGVRDDDPGRPIVLPPDPLRVGGNGMRVVDVWSDRWGVQEEATGGKTVWFLVRLP